MAQRVQLRNSLLFCLVLWSCNSPQKKSIPKLLIKVNALEGNFNNANGIIFLNQKLFTGTVFTLYPNTTDTAELANYNQGMEDGIWKKFYPNHHLQEQREYRNSKKIGIYIAFWENGKKKLRYLFNNDEYEGICQEWNRNGVLIREMNYEKGHESGPQKLFYDNGKIRANYTILNGRRYGLLGTKNCVNATDTIAIMP